VFGLLENGVWFASMGRSQWRLVCLDIWVLVAFGLFEKGVLFASMSLVSMAFGSLGCLGLSSHRFCVGGWSLWKEEHPQCVDGSGFISIWF
jgi:hypothetical protein